MTLAIEVEGDVFIVDYDDDDNLIEKTKLDRTLVGEVMRDHVERALREWGKLQEVKDGKEEDSIEITDPQGLANSHDDTPLQTRSNEGSEKREEQEKVQAKG